ncbi:MAG: tetratricopeptide repeat protein, partial [Candidatus Helarchaeota archaeon]
NRDNSGACECIKCNIFEVQSKGAPSLKEDMRPQELEKLDDVCKICIDNAAVLFQNKGTALRQLRKYNQALSSFEASIELNSILNKKSDVAWTHGSMAVLYKMWGRLDDAIEQRKESLKIYEEINDIEMQRSTIRTILELYGDLSKENSDKGDKRENDRHKNEAEVYKEKLRKLNHVK